MNEIGTVHVFDTHGKFSGYQTFLPFFNAQKLFDTHGKFSGYQTYLAYVSKTQSLTPMENLVVVKQEKVVNHQ